MSKKVLVLSGSPRKGANSDLLCDEFIKGVDEAGHRAEKILLREKEVHYCIGCDACKRKDGICIHKDDMTEILEKMIAADVLVLASPVYYYNMDAQMKTLVDRTYARLNEIRGKKVYYILTGAADQKHYMDTAVAAFRGFQVCLPESEEKGIVYGIGVMETGAVKTTLAMQEAFVMGKSI